MAAECVANFNTWLSDKLFKLNNDVDLEVFVSYITGILETETSHEDQHESLMDIISEILPDNSIAEHCSEIIDKWTELTESSAQSGDHTVAGIDTTIHNIIEKQTAQVSVVKPATTDDDNAYKKAILAHYANVSEGEESDEGTGHVAAAVASKSAATAASAAAAATTSTADLLVKNMNALKVKERERQERDQAKQNAEVKRQKDKEDREKQKQKAQERKDNEKKRTQKGEKKR
jgi:hypothetical protein